MFASKTTKKKIIEEEVVKVEKTTNVFPTKPLKFVRNPKPKLKNIWKAQSVFVGNDVAIIRGDDKAKNKFFNLYKIILAIPITKQDYDTWKQQSW